MDFNLFLSKSNEKKEFEVDIVKLPLKKLLYIQITLKSPELVSESYRNIKKWSETRDLTTVNSELLGLLQDYPLYTSLNKCRFSTCVSVNLKPNKLTDNVSYMEIPPRTYVSFKVKGGITELIKFITKLNTFWIPQSGYEFTHFPAIIKPLENPLTEHQHNINHQVFIAIQPK